ncbi:MAG: trypsin-like peptidase domain-containing protein [Minisyncoccales bacterium]
MLSIIIPTLNEEEFLPILLQQIKKQTFKDYEIIVADGGSTDRTIEIAQSFGCRIVQGGSSVAASRNAGGRAAQGEILLFTDADNFYWPDDFLENLLTGFQKRNLAVASFPIYPQGNFFDRIAYGLYNFWVSLTQHWTGWATNSVLVKKEIFEKVGGFDEEIKMAEDHWFAKQAAKMGRFGFIKTKPILTSARRLEQDGRFKTYLHYLLAGLYLAFFGPIKKPIFKYEFSSYQDLSKKEKRLKYKIKKIMKLNCFKNKTFWLLVLVIFLSSLFGFGAGFLASNLTIQENFSELLNKLEIDKSFRQTASYQPQTTQEEAIIKVVKEAAPAVVSIVITKDVPIIEQYFYNPFKEFEQFFGEPFEFEIPQYQQKGTEKREVGGGTGFIISEDGLILTNKHVVSDEKADYTVLTNDGQKYPAKVLARDPLKDIALIKIDQAPSQVFPVVKLGDSDTVQIGQTVIAIGNALGEFRNTVSVGVISGLSRTITASGGGIGSEVLEDIIQTDAAINQGNSGGPLLNLKGEVIGINSAMVLQAQNIGFAIPINQAKKSIEQVKTLGKIVYPFLGVRYSLIDDKIQKENNLSVNYGAWIVKGDQNEPAIVPNSAADKAGLKENDIILEFNNEKITLSNSLAKIIAKYNPGDKVILKILRDGQEKNVEVVLGERNE